jgi:CMP-N,N'-diacetyllegionaminic acid synthase
MIVAAIITARGGSKGVPKKNIRPLMGKPLVLHTIEVALKSRGINVVVVTTDDSKIREISVSAGASAIERPKELASDASSSADAVLHAIDALAMQGRKPDIVVLLQPTSPGRTAQHVEEALDTYMRQNCRGSVVSVCECEHHPLKSLMVVDGNWVPSKDWATLELPRQDLPKAYRVNGAIYIVGTGDFLAGRHFFAQPFRPYVMPVADSIDIDTEEDFAAAEVALQKRLLAG